MTEKNIDYVPISKLGRGYAGQAIDNMNANESVIYILRNNEPTAVIISFEDYQNYLKVMKSADRLNKTMVCDELAGSLRGYADTSKIDGEKEFYKIGLAKKYGK